MSKEQVSKFIAMSPKKQLLVLALIKGVKL